MNKITITKGGQLNQRHLYSNSEWFNVEYYAIKDDGECLTITKCYLDIPDDARKMNKKNTITIVSDIPFGEYLFDKEESNEDIAVVYYKL